MQDEQKNHMDYGRAALFGDGFAFISGTDISNCLHEQGKSTSNNGCWHFD
jgi:hypothetical protein